MNKNVIIYVQIANIHSLLSLVIRVAVVYVLILVPEPC